MLTSFKKTMLAGTFFLTALTALASIIYINRSEPPKIRIGILHSLSGTMANSEIPLIKTLQVGIDEINKQGGLLGRQLEAVITDSQSNDSIAAHEAERLIVAERVDVIFGCWTSSCRKAVKPIIEQHNHLLFYPVQYEGLEQSKNIIYTGVTPNQQIIPATNWVFSNLGKRVYLLGSDYIFPKLANIIIRDIAAFKNASILAERYIPLGSQNFNAIFDEIKNMRPDVIFNTINGDSNQSFFNMRHLAGLDDIPVISFSITEVELATMSHAASINHYASWSYFQSLDSPKNHEFISKITQNISDTPAIGDPMEATYIGLQLWAEAVRQAETLNPRTIINTLQYVSINAPEGIVSIDRKNNHLNKHVYIGRARPDGQFDIIWRTENTIRPVPFPSYRSRDQWNNIIQDTLSQGIKQ